MFKPFLILASILLAVAACSEYEPSSLTKTRDVSEFKVSMVLVPTESKITELCTKLGVKYEANACAAINLKTNHCTIYVMPQRYAHDRERLALIGHEIWHCRYGEWHD